jgi:hypothetical protein
MAQNRPFRRGIAFRGFAEETGLIAQCCVCGLVRAKKRFPAEPDLWVTSRAYQERYGVTLLGSLLTHTYCSGCYVDFMQRVKPRGHTVAPPRQIELG